MQINEGLMANYEVFDMVANTLQGIPVTLEKIGLTEDLIDPLDREMGVYVVVYRLAHQIQWVGDILATDSQICIFGQLYGA